VVAVAVSIVPGATHLIGAEAPRTGPARLAEQAFAVTFASPFSVFLWFAFAVAVLREGQRHYPSTLTAFVTAAANATYVKCTVY
jgi:hypothetical protein